MRTTHTLLGFICLFWAIVVLFPCCQNVELDNGSITYKGRVITLTGNQPMSNITVRITNGTIVRASMVTQSDGLFRLSVLFSELDASFYLELVDQSGNSKKDNCARWVLVNMIMGISLLEIYFH